MIPTLRRSTPPAGPRTAAFRSTCLRTAVLIAVALAAPGVLAQPDPAYDPGPKAKAVVGWPVAAPCLGDDGATLEGPAARAAACPPRGDRPTVLEAANGELYLLRDVDAEERIQIASRAGRPVRLAGTFAWHGRLRTLSVDAVTAVPDAEAEAARSEAPEYQMQQYFLTLLKPGPAQETVSAERQAELTKAHFDHIASQAAAGTLLLAGPFGEQKPTRRLSGLYLYAVDSLEEAERLTGEDPSVAAGYFEAATLPWYGPASLGY